eukprot:5887602-Prymnesium_polylepis.3
MAHCAGPWARKAAQDQATERQASPCAEGARAGTPGRPSVSVGRPKVAHLCAPACYAVKKKTITRGTVASFAHPRAGALFASAVPVDR